MANFNLKSVFTADTEGLKKGAADAKAVVKDFDESTTSALNEVTALFGTSMGDISRTLGTIKGGFLKLNMTIQGTTEAATLSARAFNILKVAMAASGIGLIVAALGSLVAYFTKSQRGADQLAVAMGQLKQVFLVISDAAIAIGRTIVNGFTKTFNFIENRWKTLKSRMGIKDVAKEEEDADKNVFQRRKELTLKQQALERYEIELIEKRAKLEKQIAEERLIADDRTQYSAEQRLAAINKAKRLTDELNKLNKDYASQELALMEEEASLSESTNEDYKAIAEKKAEILKIDQQTFTQTKELVTKQAELTAQVAKEYEARKAIEDLQAKKAADIMLPKIDGSKVLEGVKATTLIKPKIDNSELQKGVEEAKGYMVDFQNIATEFANAMTEAFTAMIEGLVSGDLNLQEIFHTLLQFLADTLKNIGKALIAYGVAAQAFRDAWKGPEGGIKAIAAGVALVAAGAVLSGLIKRASSGPSGGGGGSIGSNYSAATVGGGGTLNLTGVTVSGQQREIKVTGVLKASGNQLLAVINNENQRKNLTT